MSSVHGINTKPELSVRRILHKLGYRYRLHKKDLPGCPDIVLKKHKKIILVHGCFWHQHPGCKNSTRPKSNKEYWDNKLNANVRRDNVNKLKLMALGWSVLIIWECEAGNPEILASTLKNYFNKEPVIK
jgi:DNA mismatch endonuclease (patch repair protein)